MDLLLWRHAEAEAESVTALDADRALTRRGRKDAAKMAKWLKEHLPTDTIVLSSPARRCQETVAALRDISGIHVTTAEFLSVDSSIERIRKELSTFTAAKTILVVGHQPNLGSLLAKLVGMQESSCVVKKGAVWWLHQRSSQGNTAPQTYLLTVQHPDYL